VEEKDIDEVEAETSQAGLEGGDHPGFDLDRIVADVMFGQHPDSIGEAAGEGHADYLLGFSVSVAGGDIDQ
jgi:hypothetical protein